MVYGEEVKGTTFADIRIQDITSYSRLCCTVRGYITQDDTGLRPGGSRTLERAIVMKSVNYMIRIITIIRITYQ